MRFKLFLPVLIASSLLVTLGFCSSKRADGDEFLLDIISELLESKHYQPRKLNDDFSKSVFENYMDKIDSRKQLYTEKQVSQLKKKYACEIDDAIKTGNSEFVDTTWAMVNSRVEQLKNINNELLSKPIDFNASNETYTVEEETNNYPKNEEVLVSNWKKYIKFNVLDRLYRKLEAQKVKDSASKVYPYDTLELKARQETEKSISSWFKRLQEMDTKDKLSFYANVVSEVFDPHTNYFPPEDKDNFDIQMTGKLEGIGATLSQREGLIVVERIVAGSASYKQGELKAGDKILKVAQGKDEPVDVQDMKLDDAIQLIRGKKGTEVRLTVKKVDGSLKVIPIVRDEVIIEESYARSALLNFENEKYGIIYLPSYYADFNASGRGRNSSNDVKKEVEKLMNEGVNGIIIDLRNNGGGSLADAIEMTGHFIPSGPVVQVRQRNNKIQTGDDNKPSVLYNGPLVVLTNYFSASASEIMAAALQDYKRAIVVGTKSTYGKGTVQTFYELPYNTSKTFPKGLGSMKVTIQKFYRINGKTTQLNGVTPDIIVPDLYDNLDLGEKDMKYHLEFDEIPAAKYSTYGGLQQDKLQAVINSAKSAVATSNYFSQTIEKAKVLSNRRKSETYNLNLAQYSAQIKRMKEEDDALNVKYTGKLNEVLPLAVDLVAAEGDETKTAQKKEWLKMYKDDAVVDLAVVVLKEWHSQK